MKRMNIGKTDMNVSVVALGTLSIGGESVRGPSDDGESLATIDTAYDLGINYFDTAPVYGFGRSERLLGKAIKKRRKDVIVSSKCGLVWDREGSLLYSRDGYDVKRNLTADNIKREIVKRRENDTTLICKTLHLQGRALKNKVVSDICEVEAKGGGFEALYPLIAGDRMKRAWEEGDVDVAPMMVGQSIGLIHEVLSCKDIIEGMVREAVETLDQAGALFRK